MPKKRFVSLETRKKMSLARSKYSGWHPKLVKKKKPEKYICPECNGKKSFSAKHCMPCKSIKNTGENNPSWKGGAKNSQAQRVKFHETIRDAVLKRDNYTCQMCDKRGGKLQVDHIQSWAEYVELRFSMDNCRTLCMDCHYLITFGKVKPKNIQWGGEENKIKSIIQHG